ncbi:hypothetical protein [Methanocalculus sp.]|uniref:hypothetical protein n=1 Tax=Methanocalculus sp. TaxID=2004547 RepID=UPI00261E6BCD|nr:hypothetical protein [Methanocalculus sp.]MDG6251571.1 hypothetical protein [Methanocalculus sp.]
MAYPSEKKAGILIVGSLLVILLFHLTIQGAGPAFFSHPYDPALPDGKLVVYSGIIDDIRTTWSGGHTIIILSDVKVFIPGGIDPPPLRIGDPLKAYGLLSTYDGEREIIIRKGSDLIPG